MISWVTSMHTSSTVVTEFNYCTFVLAWEPETARQLALPEGSPQWQVS